LEFHGDFWHQKTIIPGLLHGVVCVILGSAIFVELRVVPDGQADGHTLTANTMLA